MLLCFTEHAYFYFTICKIGKKNVLSQSEYPVQEWPSNVLLQHCSQLLCKYQNISSDNEEIRTKFHSFTLNFKIYFLFPGLQMSTAALGIFTEIILGYLF